MTVCRRGMFMMLLLGGVVARSQTLSDRNAQIVPGEERVAASGHNTTLPLATTKRISGAALRTAGLAPRSGPGPAVTQIGSVVTASPAESFALNGNLAYVCDDNEVSVVDVTNPTNPQIVATALSGLIQKSADIHCAIQRNTLAVFADQVSTGVGNSPGFSAFSLGNPLQPQLIAATPINKRFLQQPVYIENVAYLPAASLTFFGPTWDNQLGDLVAVDVTNFSSPSVTGTLEPQIDPVYGGATSVFGATLADTALLYIGGSTSTGTQNNGAGRLQVVDVTPLKPMKVVGQLLIPGTLQFTAPMIQGTVAVGIGNTGGYAPNSNPNVQGNIVVATFDVSDRRSPAILSINTTSYKVGLGGGATRIGNFLFAFAGVLDANNNQVLLIVDVSNPLAPVLTNFPISQPFSSMQAVGSTLYATLGSGGFATYSIPGISSGPPSVCPVSMDAMLVIDRGANITGQAFLDAKAALKSFIDSLQLSPDQVGEVSFTNTAHVDQTLTTNGTQAKTALDNIILGGTSYIGAGIAAAQGELTSARHNGSATPIVLVLSDGADRGAPNSSATLAAANAAKAAGMVIISVQYGANASTLMQSIASTNTNFYLVGP